GWGGRLWATSSDGPAPAGDPPLGAHPGGPQRRSLLPWGARPPSCPQGGDMPSGGTLRDARVQQLCCTAILESREQAASLARGGCLPAAVHSTSREGDMDEG
ncbi:unnamed protein product, partial [Discosporangium mesarthrocarpum]